MRTDLFERFRHALVDHAIKRGFENGVLKGRTRGFKGFPGGIALGACPFVGAFKAIELSLADRACVHQLLSALPVLAGLFQGRPDRIEATLGLTDLQAEIPLVQCAQGVAGTDFIANIHVECFDLARDPEAQGCGLGRFHTATEPA